MRSVSCLGVVPWEAMLPTRLLSFSLILLEIASFNSAPLKFLKSLSARYFNFNSFGVPTRPLVNAGDTSDLERAMRSVCDNYELAEGLGKAAYDRTAELYERKIMLENQRLAYTKLLGE